MNWKVLHAMALGMMWMGGYMGSPRAWREHAEALRAEDLTPCACQGDAGAEEVRSLPGAKRLGGMFDA